MGKNQQKLNRSEHKRRAVNHAGVLSKGSVCALACQKGEKIYRYPGERMMAAGVSLRSVYMTGDEV